ncbi:MAG: hypothetical protein ACE5FD_11070 [Anaerolineae bacterium]
MKRVAFSIILLALVLLLGGTVYAGEGDTGAAVSIRISITPVQGDPGAEITVTGTGADPTLAVFVTLSPQADSAEGALVTVEVNPADDGSFSATLTVPDDTPDGRYAVRAEQFAAGGNVLQYYWNAFTVGAGGEGPLLPVTGTLPGTTLTITAGIALFLLAVMLGRGLYGAVGKK